MKQAKKLPLIAAAVVLALGVLDVIYLTQPVAALAVILILLSIYAETLHRRVYSHIGVRHPDFVLYSITAYLAAKAIDFQDGNFFLTPFLRLALYGLAVYLMVKAFRDQRPSVRRR
jgi:hypothetical protein